MAIAVARQSDKLGLYDHTARLLDLSGDDSILISYLSARADGTLGNPHISSADAGAAAEQLRALQSSRKTFSNVPDGGLDGAGGQDQVGLFRRMTMLAGVARLPQV